MRFLLFEVWSLKIVKKMWKMDQKIFVLEDVQCSETDATPIFKVFRILASEIWLILYS